MTVFRLFNFVQPPKPSIFVLCFHSGDGDICFNKQKMNQAKILVQKITEGIQEKKGQNIVVADLTEIDDTICDYFVICEGNTPTQVAAITDSIEDYVRIHANEKPIGTDGLRNAQWVAMDYSNVIVHIFLPEVREFYNLENLWADAQLTEIPNID